MKKQEMISSLEVDYSKDLYRITDMLNKSLKSKGVIVGLTLKNEDTAVLTVYET
ncbi:DUF4264 family protein [Salimicrobium flavidum]|uniref:DUF4264 domain-containing protein n=1 Tax=Salimicrobium flavidum TaxID=570947 RepID=A0A1N7IJP0_9BACI|nr:DUF4264 family protein [Salimicrobium flavidum]SIS37201.1 Protein of unknown function [Salimicrobium flavidum]